MPAFIDLTGNTFSKLTVVNRDTSKKGVFWNCKCACGKDVVVKAGYLRNGKTKSCGCLKRPVSKRKMDLSGHKYNKLSVIKEVGNKWECLCDCGNTTFVSLSELRSGHTKSCGCIKGEYWKTHDRPEKGKPSRNRKDCTGMVKGKITILSYKETINKRTVWNALCDCGTEFSIVGKVFLSGNTKSCGCLKKGLWKRNKHPTKGQASEHLRKISTDKIGSKFGKLTLKSVVWNGISAGNEIHQVAFGLCDCECGTKNYKARMNDLSYGKTLTCGCGAIVSQEELALSEWLSGYIDIKTQFNINGWKYDILVPDKKILIEYNGCYWHSSKFVKNDKQHLVKRRNAEDEGYQVLNIWSDDFNNNSDFWKNFILSKVGCNEPEKIGARKTKLAFIDRHEAIKHHVKYHSQKSVPVGSVHVGAYFKDKLIAVATMKNSSVFELSRYTVIGGMAVIGLLSKIIKFTEKEYGAKDWITYCNKDHFSGKLYLNSGFTKTTTSLQMSYLVSDKRFRREGFMKHKLPLVFDTVDMKKTEREICAENNVYASFNSGIDKFERF